MIEPTASEAKSDHARHLDELLDEALEETFPASDPIAIRLDDRPTEPAPGRLKE